MDKDKEEKCTIPPKGWYCTRKAGHDGICAALPTTDNWVERFDKEFKGWWRDDLENGFNYAIYEYNIDIKSFISREIDRVKEETIEEIDNMRGGKQRLINGRLKKLVEKFQFLEAAIIWQTGYEAAIDDVLDQLKSKGEK